MSARPTQPVLVIERDVDLRDGIITLLERHGYRTVGVDSEAKASSYLHGDRERPCLVLLGVTAPDLEGYELHDDVARTALDTDIPIATMSRFARRFPSADELIHLVEERCLHDDTRAADPSARTR